MRAVALPFAAVLAYALLGGLTYGPTRDALRGACQTAPGVLAHTVFWPLSWSLAHNLPSAC